MRDRQMLWTGRVLSGLVILFLAMDLTIKFMMIQPVIDTHIQLGLPHDAESIRMLATILLIATLLYAWPRTAVLGAILLTGYLGGAVATHVRVGSPLFTHILFGVYLGVAAWGGLWFRDARLRVLIPLSN